jgi:hypothetical protein
MTWLAAREDQHQHMNTSHQQLAHDERRTPAGNLNAD